MLFSRGKKETLSVRGMSCPHCEQAVEKGVQEMPGINKVKANHEKDRVEIFYKGNVPDLEAVSRKITDLGYEVVTS